MKDKANEIIHNATVIYTDNVKEQFEAIKVTDRGVITGRIIDKEFFTIGFINKNVIKKIIKYN